MQLYRILCIIQPPKCRLYITFNVATQSMHCKTQKECVSLFSNLFFPSNSVKGSMIRKYLWLDDQPKVMNEYLNLRWGRKIYILRHEVGLMSIGYMGASITALQGTRGIEIGNHFFSADFEHNISEGNVRWLYNAKLIYALSWEEDVDECLVACGNYRFLHVETKPAIRLLGLFKMIPK